MKHRIFRPLAVIAGILTSLVATQLQAQTLGFDSLPTTPATNSGGNLVDANGGSRTISGVTFNAADNSDWEIYGKAFVPDPANSLDPFLSVRSNSYALAGNAFVGSDYFGTTYTGLTISTSKLLTSLYVGYDDNGGGSNDADALTIFAFGAGGDLGSISTSLSSKTLSVLDTTASFTGLTGITGYRFETESADGLDAAYGRAYVIIDDMSFDGSIVSPPPPVPEPATYLGLVIGMAALVTRRTLRWRDRASRR